MEKQFTVRFYGVGWCASVLIDWEVDDDFDLQYQDETWEHMVNSAYDTLRDDGVNVSVHGEPECDEILEGWQP